MNRAAQQSGLTFTVNSTGDAVDSNIGNGVCATSGSVCTLRAAIQEANATTVADTIQFNISGSGVKTIQPTSQLPTITNPVTINGATQPGYSSTPLIALNGASAGAAARGLSITASNTTIRALAIYQFDGDGINLSGNGIHVEGCFIGTNAAGTSALGNHSSAISMTGANGVFGGTTASTRNIISGNSNKGISISGSTATGNLIQGNYIGTDVTGAIDLGNTYNGVAIWQAPNNTVGGTSASARNIISGNNVYGISIAGTGANGTLVQGNYIGLKANGTQTLGNSSDGIYLETANNTIGGTVSGAGNVISGNGGTGVTLYTSAATGNLVQGNFIGTNPAGTVDLGNTYDGIGLGTASNNTIGGTSAAARNIISGNNRHGVYIGGTATGNLVQGNYIGTDVTGTLDLGNTYSGIDLNGGTSTVGGITSGTGNLISGNDARGIEINSPSSGNLIQGNTIGTDVTGTLDRGNTQQGIMIWMSGSNTIGGTTSGARNVISGNNGEGIYIGNTGASNNLVQGNYIGTNAAGTAALGNSSEGILIVSASNTIGGTAAGAGNLISGNGNNGIGIDNSTATGNLVQGNYIGTDATGTVDLGNAHRGVDVWQAASNTIGGTSTAARNVISGNNWDGMYIGGTGASNNLVQGNYIGTNAAGTAALGNSLTGMTIASANNTIGGTAAGAGNLISGNSQRGIDIDSSTGTGNLVQGNYIGTDVTGTLDLGNIGNGISIWQAPSNTIGGTSTAARNVISGNNVYGISITGAGANNNLVQGNYIGTTVSGTAALGNTNDGLYVETANNTIGGTTAGAGNVISANGGNGISLNTSAATGTVVQSNFIGTDPAGTVDLGNTQDGIVVWGAVNNTIGGTAAGAGNTIAFNSVGLYIWSGTGIAIRGNSFFGNDALGIDLNPTGVNANDTADADTGTNNKQNYPVLTTATYDGLLTINGSLNSTPSTSFSIDFYANSLCDSSQYGEGKLYLGSYFATTDASGNVTFSSPLDVNIPANSTITATATDANGNTSEFSACTTVAFISGVTLPWEDRVVIDPDGNMVVRDELLVGISFNTADPQTRIAQIAATYNGVIIGSIPQARFYQLQFPAVTSLEDLETLRLGVEATADVEFASHDYLFDDIATQVIPNDAEYFRDPGDQWDENFPGGTNWYHEVIRSASAWELSTGSSDIKLAMLDTGFQDDPVHVDLVDNYVTRRGPTTQLGSWNSYGHGTITSGAACAVGNNGIGIAGVAWDCSIIFYELQYKFLLVGGYTSSAAVVLERMIQAVDDGARVVNNSWTANYFAYSENNKLQRLDELNDTWATALNYAEIEDKDVLWVFSAGNDSQDIKYVSPASLVERYPLNTITVAAIDLDLDLADFSNYGDLITVAAPGESITTTVPYSQGVYLPESGTSIAAPQVSGLAILVMAHNPDFNASQVKNCIVGAAETSGRAVPGHNFHVIDAPSAVACSGFINLPPKVDIVFSLDLTGSMGDELNHLKTEIADIIPGLEAVSPTTDFHFAIVSYKDYPYIYDAPCADSTYSNRYGGSGDYPFRIEEALTTDANIITTNVAGLSVGGGSDSPESYGRALWELGQPDTAQTIGFRPDALKLVINFGDDVPHDPDLNWGFDPPLTPPYPSFDTGYDPGRNNIVDCRDYATDDIDFQLEALQALIDNQIRLLHIDSSGNSRYVQYWQLWAGMTGGTTAAINRDGTIPDGLNLTELIINMLQLSQ